MFWGCRWTAKSLGVIALGSLLMGLPAQVGAEDFSTRIGKVDEAPAEGLHADAYRSAELGFSVEWDADMWTATEPEDSAGAGAALVSELSQGIVIGFAKNRTSMEACVDVSAGGIENAPLYSDFGPAPSSYDRPDLPENAAGELYVAEVDGSGEEVAFYIECREVVETDTIVFITFGTMLPTYEEALPSWQAVFDSIETADE
ncbi:MAG: hypothetical protein IT336_04365 [Thermomicrobiales bacterium]|nr:hypothetical protein [Thermomicrobiales bacterium]